jgi:hypothetical protein
MVRGGARRVRRSVGAGLKPALLRQTRTVRLRTIVSKAAIEGGFETRPYKSPDLCPGHGRSIRATRLAAPAPRYSAAARAAASGS